MKKISFSQLEKARNNPKAFAKSLDNPDGSTPRFSKFMAWQLAVFEYHKQKSNISKAINYFDSLFSRNFANNTKNKIEKEEWIEQLEAYTLDEIKRKLICVEHKKRISIPLTGKIRLGGELPLIKMNNKLGYSVYFFSRSNTPWEDELRFPIIQNYISQVLYNVDLSEVEVGIYSLDSKKHFQNTYKLNEVQEALKELTAIGNAVSLALK